jgi:hypothetical protein
MSSPDNRLGVLLLMFCQRRKHLTIQQSLPFKKKKMRYKKQEKVDECFQMIKMTIKKVQNAIILKEKYACVSSRETGNIVCSDGAKDFDILLTC